MKKRKDRNIFIEPVRKLWNDRFNKLEMIMKKIKDDANEINRNSK